MELGFPDAFFGVLSSTACSQWPWRASFKIHQLHVFEGQKSSCSNNIKSFSILAITVDGS
jgi:hypothetical protein